MSTMGAIGRQLLGIVLGGACVLGASCATAQITPDRTLPNNSNVTINGSVFNITGGTQAGRNLFHSFQQFSVPTGSTASFNNGLDIQNIFSRVTGSEVSYIDGLIKASGTANLFFLNPNGIVFGKNASLNIGGSFVATTANAIQFGNLGTFSASVPNNPALLTVNPSALFYNQIADQGILNQSIQGLQVPNGKSLLLVGGNVNLDGGRLTANGGRVELAGLAAPGTVGLNVAGDTLSLSVPNDVQRGDISLSNQAFVNVSGAGRGDIAVNARNLNVQSNSLLLAGIDTGLGNSDSKAGDININADAIAVDSGYIANVVGSNAKGNAGNINITTGSLSATHGAQINSFTRGKGNAGNVTITARNTVTFDGVDSNGNRSASVSEVLAGGVGNGGNINITAGSLSLTNGGELSTSIREASNSLAGGQGVGGTVNLNLRDALTISGTNSGIFGDLDTGAVGRGGDIKVQAGDISVTDGGRIRSSTFGQGDAGNISITAHDGISLDNTGYILSNVQSNTAQGNAGNIDITTGSLRATHGAQINTFTSGMGNAGNVTISAKDAVTFDGVNSDSLSNVLAGGVGNGGKIDITAGSLSLTNGGGLSVGINGASGTLAAGKGLGGTVNLNVTNALTISGTNSGIFGNLNTGAVGRGGDINIQAGNVFVKDGGLIRSTTYGKGNAGDISITASDGISLDGASYIQDNVVGNTAQGNAGNIDITTGSLSLTHGAQIDSLTSGLGNAGNVTIIAKDAVTFDGVDSNANSSGLFTQVLSNGMGNGGYINIQAGEVFVTNNGEITSDTRGRGNSGDITIKTRTLTTRNSNISTTTLGIGNAGNLTVIASDYVDLSGDSYNPLTPASGSPGGLLAQVDRLGQGKGGNLYIKTGRLSISNGSKVQVATLGDGNAGNLFIHADEINVFNTGNSYFFPTSISVGTLIDKRVQEGIIPDLRNGKPPIGNGGSLTIETRQLNVTNGGQITTSSVGQGKAGYINIIADIATLNNGQITAQTASSDGGDINFNLSQYLLLRSGSLISSTAGTAEAGGNGGNITINTPFVIAFPLENSDITANAFSGSGGRVMINATGIFNIAPLSLQDLERLRPSDLDPRQLPTNDITAISQTNPSLSGQVTINSPDIDPSRGLVTLPTVTEVAPKLVDSTCAAFDEKSGGSNFTVTGRGGLPSSPDEPLTSDVVWSDTRLPVTTTQHQHKTHAAKPKPQPIAIIPATGWVFNDKGEVTLISSAANATTLNTPTSCPAK